MNIANDDSFFNIVVVVVVAVFVTQVFVRFFAFVSCAVLGRKFIIDLEIQSSIFPSNDYSSKDTAQT